MKHLPTVKECFELLEKNRVPKHIIAHSTMVANVGYSIFMALTKKKDLGLKKDLVLVSCLLHDIKKMECIELDCDHAIEAYKYLKDLGLSEVAHIVRQHYRLDPENRDFSVINEVHICYYADNRVKHADVVSVDERFRDLIERYGTDEKTIRFLKKRLLETRELEHKIFSQLDFSPGALIEHLWDIRRLC